MIDFIKITNAGVSPDSFLNNPLLSFTHKVVRNTGELIEGRQAAKYLDMKFFISNSGVTGLEGSLHKYHNKGSHNYDDFSLGGIRSVVKDLQDKFGIEPKTTNLNNVEFGLNLEVPFDPDDFIDNLVTHNYTQFNIEKGKKKNYAQVRYCQYIIKIYNKGLQFSLNKNILRFEVKIVRMAKLEKQNIVTLHDLTLPEKLQSVSNLLLGVFEEIIYSDANINQEALNLNERELLRDGYNPKYWPEHHKRAGSNSSKKQRQYRNLVREFGPNHFHIIGTLIKNKWDSLLNECHEPLRDITSLEMSSEIPGVRVFTDTPLLFENDPIRDFTKEPLNNKNSRRTSSYYLSIEKDLVHSSGNITSDRICLVTGLDISMQKSSSRFLSTAGIKYYMKHSPDIFNKLQYLLTSNWSNEPLDKKIEEIAHSIRNAYHSKRIHTQKAIKKICSAPTLFNNYDLVSNQKKEIANR